MADTVRTLASLQTLLADNTTGAISPQDLRDMLVSAMGVYGHLYVTGGAAAQGAISGTPAKLTCFANNGVSDDVTVAHGTDRITIATAGVYHVGFSLSFENDTATPPHTYRFMFHKDGSATVIGAEQQCATQNKFFNVSASGLLTLAAAEYLEIYVSSPDSGNSVTVKEGSLWINRVA